MNRYTLRQKQSKGIKIAYLTVAAILIVFIVILIIGNILRTRVASARQGREDLPVVSIPDTDSEPLYLGKSAADIRSAYISPELWQNSAEEALAYISSLDCNSITLRVDGEYFAWHSDIKAKLGISDSTIGVSAEDAVDILVGKGIYVSLVYEARFVSSSHSERELFLAYDSAVLCELAKLSPSELLIIASGDISKQELQRLYDSVKAENPDVALGISIPCTLLDSEYYHAEIHKYYSIFDFIVFDFTVSDSVKYIEKASVYYSLYGARAAFDGDFIPGSDAISELNSISVDFWQCLGNGNEQVIPEDMPTV